MCLVCVKEIENYWILVYVHWDKMRSKSGPKTSGVYCGKDFYNNTIINNWSTGTWQYPNFIGLLLIEVMMCRI